MTMGCRQIGVLYVQNFLNRCFLSGCLPDRRFDNGGGGWTLLLLEIMIHNSSGHVHDERYLSQGKAHART